MVDLHKKGFLTVADVRGIRSIIETRLANHIINDPDPRLYQDIKKRQKTGGRFRNNLPLVALVLVLGDLNKHYSGKPRLELISGFLSEQGMIPGEKPPDIAKIYQRNIKAKAELLKLDEELTELRRRIVLPKLKLVHSMEKKSHR